MVAKCVPGSMVEGSSCSERNDWLEDNRCWVEFASVENSGRFILQDVSTPLQHLVELVSERAFGTLVGSGSVPFESDDPPLLHSSSSLAQLIGLPSPC